MSVKYRLIAPGCRRRMAAGLALFMSVSLRSSGGGISGDDQLRLVSGELSASAAAVTAESKRGVSLEDLVPVLRRTVLGGAQGRFGIYLEDLTCGTSVGINEDCLYDAWSLLKVPVLLAVLKKIEQGQLSSEQRVVMRPQHLLGTSLFPEPYKEGDESSVRELMERLIRFSDNSASAALSHLFTADEFQRCLSATGLPVPGPDKPKNTLPRLSPRQYAGLLRCLYHGCFVEKSLSAYALKLMTETVYDSQIRSGLPPGITVAHKVGFNAGSGDFHDCGIVYRPGRPYILCVMSAGSTREEADQVISAVSAAIHDHLESERKGEQ